MTLNLYNTLTKRKDAFIPANPERVTMYVCGPTVWNRAHIGNARPPVIFDVLNRLLRHTYGDAHVLYARNITDVEDKINKAAADEGVAIDVITGRFEHHYLGDMQALGVLPPDFAPHATAHMADIIAMVERLLANGAAYAAEGHVLFSVAGYSNYGKLSGRNMDEMIAGARVEVAPYKKDPADFVLWKPSTPEQPGWDSPWGRGRPGWHIECSAMIKAVLGDTIDIHAGGQDLIFPHHENEIAQSACANHAPLARYWLHNGFLSMDKEKMSKSIGNVRLISDILAAGVKGEVMRLALLSAHYRQPLDWTDALVEQSKKTLDRWYGLLRGQAVVATAPSLAFMAALADDLNTPQAMAELAKLAGERDLAGLKASAALLGVLGTDADEWFTAGQSMDIDAQITARNAAKATRDFVTADRIRDDLKAAGILLEDGPAGTSWKRM